MSKTGIGVIVSVVFMALQYFGVGFPTGTEANFAEAVTVIVGIVMLVWGQMSRKDLKYGLFRNE